MKQDDTHPRTVLVTGGAGFIGSNLVRMLLSRGVEVVNLDKLTYAGNRSSVADLEGQPGYTFVHGDICDRSLVRRLLADHGPGALLHLAAETHVDRSIASADRFVETNLLGSYTLLEEARRHHQQLDDRRRRAFRFLGVSTDEVYGTLADTGAFCESTPYDPRSPYSATKAGADHLARAYFHTHGLPVLVSACSNNYGPYQFPEKVIPLMIFRALAGQPLPVYGQGRNVREWLHVEDHCDALWLVLTGGQPGQTYNIGSGHELRNIDLVRTLCDLLQQERPPADNPALRAGSYRELISFVEDRPGHDYRYAMDAGKIRRELGWAPRVELMDGLRRTVRWYLDHQDWVQGVMAAEPRRWMDAHYGPRQP
jgi:dTDP-glucose 4,6-dehydratase